MSSYSDTRVTLSPAALHRIAVTNARSRLDLSVRNLEALRKEVAAACATYPGEITPLNMPSVPADSQDVSEIDRATARVASLWTERRRQLRSEQARVEKRLMLSSLERDVEGHATAAADVLGRPSERPEETIEDLVATVLETLDNECSERERTTIVRAAEQTLRATTAQRQKTLLDSLSDAVNGVNTQVNLRRSQAERLDRLRSDLAGVNGPEAVRLLATIDLVEEGLALLDESLVSSVATAVEHAADRAQSEYIGDVASQILLDQGYRVQVGFADHLASGSAYAQLDEWPDHAIRYTMEGDILSAEQIRVSGPTGDPTTDGAAQAELCAHHERFLTDLEARGIDTENARLVPPRLLPSQAGSVGDVEFEQRAEPKQAERYIGGN